MGAMNQVFNAIKNLGYKTYNGKLIMLGNSEWRELLMHTRKVYSVVEIGDHTIKYCGTNEVLDNYLHRALNHNGEVQLEIGAPYLKALIISFVLIWIPLPYFGYMIFAFYFILLLSIAYYVLPARFAFRKIRAVVIDGKRYT